MKRVICGLVLAIVAINALNQDVAFLQKIQKTDFGRTILQTIQIQLQTSDAIDSVYQLLDKLRSGIIADGAADKKAHTQKVNDLEGRISTLGKEIKNAQEQVKSDKKSKAAHEATLQGLVKDEAEAAASLKEKQTILAKITKQRQEEHAIYKKETAKRYASITALNEGKEIIQRLQVKGTVLAEVSHEEVFAQVAATFRSLRVADEKYQGFFNLFAQMFSAKIVADQNLVNKVVEVFDKLIDQIGEEIAQLTKKEQAAKEAYESQKESLLSAISQLQALLQELASKIASEKATIADLAASIAANQQLIKKKSAEKAAAEAELAAEKQQYAKRVAKRKEEVSTIDQVKAIFQKEFNAQARSYVKNVKF